MKVRLIHPKLVHSVSKFDDNSLLTRELRRVFRLGETNYTPPLSLLMLAAVTPSDVDIQIIDERLDEIRIDDSVDLVGITATTRVAPRVYEIAAEYRRRGVAVVVGGVHPSILPEESSQYVDAVVVGEGEKVWPQILTDYKAGNLKRIYQGEPQHDLDALPFPRREVLWKPQRYATTRVIATGRGCPNNCTFCSAGFAVGKSPRLRSVDRVLAEISETPGTHVVFVDDNLAWNMKYAKTLLEGIASLKIKWIGGVSISALEDTEFADLAAESGCIMLLIGFESIRRESISEMNKQRTNDPSRYRELIMRMHERGIMVKGQFILGFDADDKDVFQELVDFVNETCIEMPTVNTLVPYPGTPIFQQYERENRLLHKNWSFYDTAGGYVVYEPKQMTAQELVDGYLMAVNEIYSAKSIVHRLKGARTVKSVGALSAVHYNLQKRRSTALEKAMLGATSRKGVDKHA